MATGVLLDHKMLYFDARLSRAFPTVEIRVADVCLFAEDVGVVSIDRAPGGIAFKLSEKARVAPEAREFAALPRQLLQLRREGASGRHREARRTSRRGRQRLVGGAGVSDFLVGQPAARPYGSGEP